jgi:hypothetical protein
MARRKQADEPIVVDEPQPQEPAVAVFVIAVGRLLVRGKMLTMGEYRTSDEDEIAVLRGLVQKGIVTELN